MGEGVGRLLLSWFFFVKRNVFLFDPLSYKEEREMLSGSSRFNE